MSIGLGPRQLWQAAERSEADNRGANELSVLYRGPLSSCNYDCHYCPFAKRHESQRELAVDEAALRRFVAWCENPEPRLRALRVFFTPWGEALTRRWYWEAFQRLTRLPQVSKVAAQTNLSAGLDWLEGCDVEKVGMWCTFHPSQTDRRRFLSKVDRLRAAGVSFSVGVVGLKEDLTEIRRLRSELPPEVYLWVNAYKREPDYYSPADIEQLTAIDPQFPTNNTRHPSRGKACRCGDTVVSVDGDGDVRRCHFVERVIGNLYDGSWQRGLCRSPCPKDVCGCHIGYVHMPSLDLYSVYGRGVLERRPTAAFSKLGVADSVLEIADD